jgi:drug/metabolite transporter (DMT)-like permease
MGIGPLALILAAAVAHAGWNLVAKRAGGGLPFVWLCAAAGVLLYTPAALIQLALDSDRLSLAGLGFMAGSGALHAGYFTALQRGYALGDLSLVYPLARGIAPLLSVIAAIVILGESATAVSLAGAALIVAAIISLATGARGERTTPAIALAVVTGALTAAYTVWDSHAVTALHQPVIVYFWGGQLILVALLAGPAWRRRPEVVRTVRRQWRSVLAVGALSPAAYILVLVALTLAPVVVVAPAREVSIVFGVLIGANSLGEGHAVRRTVAALAIVAGVALLAVG